MNLPKEKLRATCIALCLRTFVLAVSVSDCANTASGTGADLDAQSSTIDASTTFDGDRRVDATAGPDRPDGASDAGTSVTYALALDVVGPPVGAPRLIRPQTTSYVTSRRPTLVWTSPANAREVVVEICADPECSTVEQSLQSSTNQVRPAQELSPGVHFWRVRPSGEDAGTSQTSATWWFRTPQVSTTTDTSLGITFDYNGDGYGDFAFLAADDADRSRRSPYLLLGGRDGLSADRVIRPANDSHPPRNFPVPPRLLGDIDGNGCSDFAIPISLDSLGQTRGGYRIFFGSRGHAGSSVAIEVTTDPNGVIVSPAGDFNHDGYGDYLLIRPFPPPYGAQIVLGHPTLPVLVDTRSIGRLPTSEFFVTAGTSRGDVDRDGFSDLVVYRRRTGPADLGDIVIVSYRDGYVVENIIDTQVLSMPRSDRWQPEVEDARLINSTPCDLQTDGLSDSLVASDRGFRPLQSPEEFSFRQDHYRALLVGTTTSPRISWPNDVDLRDFKGLVHCLPPDSHGASRLLFQSRTHAFFRTASTSEPRREWRLRTLPNVWEHDQLLPFVRAAEDYNRDGTVDIVLAGADSPSLLVILSATGEDTETRIALPGRGSFLFVE